jgi:hypothetical protein
MEYFYICIKAIFLSARKSYMSNKQASYLMVLVCSLLCSLISCTVYKPTGYNTLTQNVPLLKEKYELQTLFAFGSNHLEEQFAFAPAEHLSVLGNFYQNLDKTKGYSAEAGIGYRQRFANTGIIEVFGIYTNAFNDAHLKDDNGSGTSSDLIFYTHDMVANYNGYSLQFDIGRKLPHSELALGLRYGLIDYSSFYYRLKTESPGGTLLSETESHLDDNIQRFFTIAPTLKVGWTNFKFLFQLSYHVDLSTTRTGSAKEIAPYYSPVLFTIALVGDFYFKKKNIISFNIKLIQK